MGMTLPQTAQKEEGSVTTLPEDLLLLALDDQSGTVPLEQSMSLDYGLAGAVLLELLLAGKVSQQGGKLISAGAKPTGDEVLDTAMQKIGAAKRPRDLKHWVSTLSGNHLRDHIVARLVAQGIVRREEHKILWVFPSQRYPTADPLPERALRDQLRAAVLDDDAPTPRLAALIALADACKLTDTLFSKAERKTVAPRLKAIAQGQDMGKAVRGATEEMQAAVIAATMAAIAGSVAASTASSSAGH